MRRRSTFHKRDQIATVKRVNWPELSVTCAQEGTSYPRATIKRLEAANGRLATRSAGCRQCAQRIKKHAKDEPDNPQVRDDADSKVWGTFFVDPVTSGAVHVHRVHTTVL